MKADILLHIDNPHQLEKLYRQDKSGFKQQFNLLFPELQGNSIAGFWNARLNYENEDLNWGTRREVVFVIIASLAAGLIAKIPGLFKLNEEIFYQRNIGFIVLPLLIVYFAWKNKLQAKPIVFISTAILASLVFINLLPHAQSDSVLLSCIHLPVLLWCMMAYAFAGTSFNNYEKRLSFLRFNGDIFIVTTVILIAGGILTGLTINLFHVIGVYIEKFYTENIVIFGLAAAPIIGTYLTETNPQLVSKVSPVIAKIFSPLVLITLIAYLIAIFVSGKNIYQDREFLLIFNGLLLGVMAIIFFSVAGTSKPTKNFAETLVLFLLSSLTIIVNCIALSAILFRISEWGFSPNRVAVLGENILMLGNLIFVTVRIFESLINKTNKTRIGEAIAMFIPVYAVWAFVITFLLPLVFGFK